MYFLGIGRTLFFVDGFVFESPSSGSFPGGMLESVSLRSRTKQSRKDPAGHHYNSIVSVQPLRVRRFFQGIHVQSRSWKSKCGAGGGGGELQGMEITCYVDWWRGRAKKMTLSVLLQVEQHEGTHSQQRLNYATVCHNS